MIVIKGKVCNDLDYVLNYFDPIINHMTNIFLGDDSEKDDCRQDLRLRIWKLFENKERTFNTSYISTRLKFDIINFINRDSGYKWKKTTVPIDNLAENDLDSLLLSHDMVDVNNYEFEYEIEDLILKASDRLTPKHKEALTLFLSGAPTSMVRKFLGTRNRNMTRYYLLLAESIAIIREVAYEEQSDQGSSTI